MKVILLKISYFSSFRKQAFLLMSCFMDDSLKSPIRRADQVHAIIHL